MKGHMLSRKANTFTQFGTASAQATTTQLTHLSYSQKGSNRRTIIFSNGKWNTNKPKFKPQTMVNVHFETNATETSSAFFYATFGQMRPLMDANNNRISEQMGGVREYLFVRPISPVNGHSSHGTVAVWIPTEPTDLIFYISKKLPIDVRSDYLEAPSTNIISSPGILSSETLPLSTFRSPTLGFTPKTPPAPGFTTKGERSKHYDLWNGKVNGSNSISWKKHGYSGGQGSLDSGKKLNAPRWVTAADARYGFRTSIYQYREGNYKEFGNKELKGWDAVRLNAEVPAGQPMQLVIEAIRHDREEQSWKSMPEWHDLNSEIPKSQVWFGMVPSGAYGTGSSDKRYEVNVGPLSDSVIDYRLSPGYSIGLGKKLNKGDYVKNSDEELWTGKRGAYPGYGGHEPDDMRHFGFKVEWWDGKTWSTPSIHPPKDIDLKNGWGAVIFRFPRQLGENSPDLAENPQWSMAKTYDAYPQILGFKDGKKLVKYSCIGRMRVVGEDGIERMPEIVEQGSIVYATDSVDFQICIGKASQVHTNSGVRFAVADPSTYAYVNSPQFNNVYWKEGEFAPGGTMIVIGQGLNRVWDLGLTKKAKDDPAAIHKMLRNVDKTIPNSGGTQDADFLKVERVINTNVLYDSIAATTEIDVKKAWMDVFGVELSASWFDIVGTGGKLPDGTSLSPLKNQSPTKSTHYIVEHSGEKYEFPYTIAIVKIPKTWVGPVLDFDISTGTPKLTPKSLKKGVKTYLVTKTTFQQIVEQEMNLDEEIQMQLDLIEKGLSPDEVMVGNDMDHDAVTTTAEVVDQNRIDNLEEEGEGESESSGFFGWLSQLFSGPRKQTIANNPIRRRTLLPIGKTQKVALSGLGSAIVEDVTATFSADHVTSLGQGPINRNGPTHRKLNYNNFDEIEEVYVMNGKPTNPTLGWFAGATPVSENHVTPDVVERKQFGSLGQASMQARATRRGNPMEVTLINGVSRPFRQGSRRHNVR
jgi:hypothetical protein